MTRPKPSPRRGLANPCIPVLFLLALAGAAASAQDLTLEQVLDKYYQAVGGKEAWAAVTATHQKGKMQMMGMEAPIEMWVKRPHKLRMEFTLQGMTGVQAIDGDSGWQVMPFMGSTEPEPMPKETLEAMAGDVDVDGPLFNWQEKGHQVTLVGKEEVEGTPTYKLDLKLESGVAIQLFLDAEYFVPIRLKSKLTLQGQEMETTTTLSDYKEVGGLLFAHSVAAETPMGSQTITFDEIEINPAIEDSFFAMPKPEPKPEN